MATSSLVLNLIVRDQSAAGLSSAQKRFAGLATAAAGLTAGLGAVISSAASFDKTIRQVGAAANVPAQGMKSLSELALKMGADTSFSAKQAADAMLELAKGGISEADIRAGALQETLTLAAAGGLELGSAAGYMSNALNTFGLQAKDAGSVAAALAGGANASTASVESLGMALGQVGPGARLAGLSLAETTGVLAAFDNAGIKGSDAGTSLKTMLTRLIPTTDAASGAMADLGLKFTDASGNMLPITNIADQLKAKLTNLSDAQRTAALTTIFGSDATRAATILMQEGSAGLGKYIAATSDLSQAQKMAATNTAGAAGAFEAFKGSVETLGLRIGLALLPAVERLTRGATEMVNGLGTAFEGAAAVVGRFRASMATGTNPFAPLISQVQGIGDAMKRTVTDSLVPTIRNLITLLNPLALDAFRAVGLVVGGVLLPAVRGVAAILENVLGPALRAVTGFLADNKTAVQAIVVAFGAFIAITKAAMVAQLAFNTALIAFGVARTAVVAGLAAMRAAMIALNTAFLANPIFLTVAALAALAAGLVYAYKRSETFRDIVNGAFSAIKAAGASLLTVFVDIKDGVVAVGNAFRSGFTATVEVVRAAFNAIRGVWTGTLQPVLTAIARAVLDLYTTGFQLYFRLISTVVRTAFQTVQSMWTSVLRPTFNAIVVGARLLGDGFRLYFNLLASVVRTSFRVVQSIWQTVLRPTFDAILSGARLLGDGFRLYFRVVTTVVQTAFRLVQTLWTTVLRTTFTAITNGARLLADGFRLYFRTVQTVVQTAFRLIQVYWNTVLRPAFAAIQAGARTLMTAMQTVFRAISTAVQTSFRLAQSVWQSVLRPTFSAVDSGGRTLRTGLSASFQAITGAVRNSFNAIRGVWQSVLQPTFSRIQTAMQGVQRTFSRSLDGIKSAFSSAADAIGNAWGRIKGLVEGPSRFVYGVIRSLHGVLKKFAGFFGVSVGELPGFSTSGGGGMRRGYAFATGGIMPGYSPGVDNQLIAVSGGEAIMRPEWTRAVGPGFVHSMNAAARHGGVSAVQRAMGLQGFDLGGIVKGIKNKVTGTASAIMNLPEKAWEYLTDPGKILGTLAKPILGRLGSSAIPNGVWGDALRAAPKKIWSGAVDKIKSGLSGIFGGMFGGGGGSGAYSPGLTGAMAFARAHAGRPYQWGGPRFAGDSFDCSGYMNAIAAVAQGGNPWQRMWYTGNYSIPRFRPGGGGAFTIGVSSGPELGTSVGHTAGTINGMNVESRGGRGTLIGPAARGAYHPMFRRHYSLIGFKRGGVVGGDPPFDVISPLGKSYDPTKAKRLGFDMGGIMRGRGFMPKYTGAPERVLSPRQTAAFESWMGRGGGGETHVHVHNHGVIGSRMDVENWLIKSMKSLERQGRL